MTDLILRADAIEAIMAEGRKVYTSEYANAERIIYEADAVEALAMLPSADAVSREDTVTLNSPISIQAEMVAVVRCKDCKSSRVYGKTTHWLACEDVMEGQATDPDGYCYLGERKEL